MPVDYESYRAAGGGLGKGLSESLEGYIKGVAEKRKRKAESMEKQQELLIKEAGYQPVVGPTGEIIDLKPPGEFTAPTGYEYARKRPGHELVYSGGLGSVESGESVTAPTGEQLRLKSTTISRRGPSRTYEAPPRLPPEASRAITTTQKTLQGLYDVKQMFEKYKPQTGLTSRRFSSGLIGNIAMQLMGSPKEAEFKAASREILAHYVTEQTGTQRGMKEIPWLSATMPEPDVDRPDIFYQKLNRSIQAMEKNQQLLMNWLREQGYLVPDISGGVGGSAPQADQFLQDLEAKGYKVIQQVD